MKKSFKGVAYWGGTLPEGWVQQAFDTLRPVDGLVLGLDDIGGLGVGYGSSGINIVRTGDGKTRGTVPESAVSGVLVLCLVALRKQFDTLDLVDDAQATIPPVIRQYNPLYGGCWQEVAQAAEALGLMPGGQFAAQHAGLFNRMF